MQQNNTLLVLWAAVDCYYNSSAESRELEMLLVKLNRILKHTNLFDQKTTNIISLISQVFLLHSKEIKRTTNDSTAPQFFSSEFQKTS